MSFLLQPPSMIEGIGPQRAQALAAEGIETIAEMFVARASRVTSILGNVSPPQVGSWFCAAMLFRVEDVTPDIAEAFVDAGVRSVPQLADAGLRTLERAIEAAQDAGKLHDNVSLYKLAELQRNAWRARDRGMLVGRVVDKDGAPLAGTNVNIGRYNMTVDTLGRYAFDSVPEGEVAARVELPGRDRVHHFLPQTIHHGKLTGPVLHTIDDPPANPLPPLTLDEFDGDLFVHTARYRNRQVTLPLDQFREGNHFLVRSIDPGGDVKLLSLYKKRLNDVTLIERAKVPAGVVPAGVEVGSVLLLEAGTLKATSLTSADVADLKYQRWQAASPTHTRNVIN